MLRGYGADKGKEEDAVLPAVRIKEPQVLSQLALAAKKSALQPSGPAASTLSPRLGF